MLSSIAELLWMLGLTKIHQLTHTIVGGQAERGETISMDCDGTRTILGQSENDSLL